MNLKEEITLNTRYRILRYTKLLIEKLNNFSKLEFDKNIIKHILFKVSYDLKKSKFNIEILIIDHEDKEIEDFFENKNIKKFILENANLFMPFSFHNIDEFDAMELVENQIILWFEKVWFKTECVNIDKDIDILVFGMDASVVGRLNKENV